MNKDYYAVIGVEKNAGIQEIKKKYRELVKKYHPDVNKEPDAEKKFREVQEAYEVLSDEKKRKNYDQYGNENVGEGMNFGQGYYDMGNFEGLGDIFQQFFGGQGFSSFFGDDMFSSGQRRSSNRKRGFKGEDVKVLINMTLEEANEGGEHEIKYDYKSMCKKCNGTGAKNGEFKKCQTCGGSGYQQSYQNSFLGRMVVSHPCQVCGGTGSVTSESCDVCNGKGYNKEQKNVKIKIPYGSYDGLTLRFSGDGGGDLYVQIRVKMHSIFKREGNDIYSNISLPAAYAVLGGEIKIDTLYGKVNLLIPNGTQPNDIIKLRGYGTYIVGNSSKKGDMYVKCNVVLPKNISNEEKRLWESIKKMN